MLERSGRACSYQICRRTSMIFLYSDSVQRTDMVQVWYLPGVAKRFGIGHNSRLLSIYYANDYLQMKVLCAVHSLSIREEATLR